jgi:acetyl-CoA synthetase
MRDADPDVWYPDSEWREHSNLAALMRRLGTPTYDVFLDLSVEHPEKYWEATLEHLGIVFDPAPERFVDLSDGKPWARFFPGAGFNFAAACVRPPAGAADRPALIWENETGETGTLSYAELEIRTRHFAAGLLKLGVRPGDRVGFLFPNTPEAIISFLAIGYIGAVSVPLYSGYGPDAVAGRLLDAGATCLVTADGFQRRGNYVSLATLAGAVQERLPALDKLVIVRRSGASAPTFPHHDWYTVEDNGGSAAPARTAANDPFMVIYTSGTTGRPKGAVHVHGGFPLRVAQDVAFMFDFKAGDRFFWMSDMGWMTGPFSVCSVLLNKGTLVIYDGAPNMPSIGRLRDVAARHRVTHFGSTPTSVRAMAADETAAMASDAADLRVLMTGGEVMDAEAHRWYFQRFGGGCLPVINYTGGTEVSGAILTNVVLRPIAPSRFNSTTPGVRAGVVDKAGEPLAGVPGELAIFQPFVGMTRGFWRDTERYLETYWSRIPGMWVHGDLAVVEPDGQYLLLGRSDDVMKISGKRVGPSEVEGIVADGNTVAEAVAFGVPDARSGEVMVLLVVPGPHQQDTAALESQVAALVRAKMGPAFRTHAVVVVRRLAKTRNGKLIRRLARQAWLGEAPGDLNAVEDPRVFDDMVQDCLCYRRAAAPGD